MPPIARTSGTDYRLEPQPMEWPETVIESLVQPTLFDTNEGTTS